MNSNFPVIFITVYDRAKHIQMCLESLEAADGADEFTVIVGSDSAGKDEHKEMISKVRLYLKGKEKNHKFKNLIVIYHPENVGEEENWNQLFVKAHDLGFKSFIGMEDDVVVGKSFLRFMQEGLNRFEDDDRVVAINGFLHPARKHDLQEAFLYDGFAAYGFASWFVKWHEVISKISRENYPKKTLSSTSRFSVFAKETEYARTYPFLAEHYYSATDIELELYLRCEEKWVLTPPVSLTANRGMDGSGLRSGLDEFIQSMQPCQDLVSIPDKDEIHSVRYKDIAEAVPLKEFLISWAVFAVYRFIPKGFELLKLIREKTR